MDGGKPGFVEIVPVTMYSSPCAPFCRAAGCCFSRQSANKGCRVLLEKGRTRHLGCVVMGMGIGIKGFDRDSIIQIQSSKECL